MKKSKSRLHSLVLPLALSALVVCGSVYPKHSEAGLIIGAIAGDPGKGAAIGAGALGALGLSLVIITGLSNDDFPHILVIGGFGVAGAILDVNVSPDEDDLLLPLTKLLPWVDNRESLKSLAGALKQKVKEKLAREGSAKFVSISLTQEEINLALEENALTQSELAQTYKILN